MPLKNGTICTRCGKLMTKHPSGICSQCRRLSCTKPCRVCGETGRNLYDDVCSSCRSKAKSKETKHYLVEAIADTQKTLLLLEELNNGMSYRGAAKMVGLATTAAFSRIKKLLPARALDFTEVTEDGV